ncbi:MAG: acyl-CoA dehydratase activase [Myxococcota bacterium]
MGSLLRAGVDVGSTTVKLAVLDDTGALVHRAYRRHNAEQPLAVLELLHAARRTLAGSPLALAVCGSGGQPVADALRVPFVQEVVANGLVVRQRFPHVRTAIELGGQDAKVVFFREDPATKRTVVADMRMNGSCAGGTGAFIDQIAELLRVTPDEMGTLAAAGRTVYDVSGRCGVFARTDIQPLLNRGVAKEDIALSTFHAIARQTIGGLAQGVPLVAPIIFEGGPLVFNPTLVRVFAERLALSAEQVLVPPNAEVLVAIGAALSLTDLFAERARPLEEADLERLRAWATCPAPTNGPQHQFFATPAERAAFDARHRRPPFAPRYREVAEHGRVHAWLGIDGGSTTSKLVLLDREGKLIDSFYGSNEGEPVRVVRQGLFELKRRCENDGLELHVLGAGATGYGEAILATAFDVDHREVETVAHVRAAAEFCPDVSFVLDIGGQDMKAIWVHDGRPVSFQLNEACSAGCGSFLETWARSLGVDVTEVARLAFDARAPSRLGSRCTVFMNSSIITEQRNGRSMPDLMAGLCRSVVENALTKVLRLSNHDLLGPKVVAQGGTFRNDAVLRAFEQLTGREVVRAPFPGEMGAIGIALLTRDRLLAERRATRFLPWDELEAFTWRQVPTRACELCTNACLRTVVEFPRRSGTAPTLVTGNRCEKGEVLDRSAAAKARIREIHQRQQAVPDLLGLHEKRLAAELGVRSLAPPRNVTIGLPRTLEFWESLPFWSAFFRALGFEVRVSPRSSAALLEKGLPQVPSDTVCLPAKLVHGHVQALMEARVDRIFFPLMLKLPRRNRSSLASWMCPVVQGYSEVVRHHDAPGRTAGIAWDNPAFSWDDDVVRARQIARFAVERLGVPEALAKEAIVEADAAARRLRRELEEASRAALDAVPSDGLAVVIAGRPYHADHFVNHDLASHFTALGLPVLDADLLPGLDAVDVSDLRVETNNEFHTRLLATALRVADDPRLQLVQIVSFGCGHDAVLSDELTRILRQRAGKTPLVLKLDEGDNRGPVGIRVRSFVGSLRAAQTQRRAPEPTPTAPPVVPRPAQPDELSP